MLEKRNILIIGGDARTLEVIHHFSENKARVFIIGFDQVPNDNSTVIQSNLAEVRFNSIDAIILPVSGTHMDGKVEATYSDEELYLTKEMISQTPKHCVVYTGVSNSFLDNATASTDRKLVRLFARDDIAILNSIPTAEAALMLAIEQTEITVHGSQVMVLGFGRVGFTVARLFSNVGANVTVCVRKSSDIARITEMGLKPLLIKNVEQGVVDSDICINTIPHQVLDQKVISKMPASALIIDLASHPGGTDFDFANKHGVKAIHALGLPGKTAPKTAGQIIADRLTQLLIEME